MISLNREWGFRLLFDAGQLSLRHAANPEDALMLFSFFLVVAGLLTLYFGGEGLVRGSVVLASRFGLPKLMIGLLVVGFGTSMPEMLVSIQAAFGGVPELALGNVVGSNIANVLLIIGVAAVITPVARWQKDAPRGALVASAVGLLLMILCLGDRLEHWQGLLLLALLTIYLVISYRLMARGGDVEIDELDGDSIDALITRHLWAAPLAVVAGIALLVLGADLLIDGSVAIARRIGISDAIIGLSLVAFGTSLPELVTAIISSLKREPEVVLGSVIGSNIFNILAILGVTVTLHPITVAERIPMIDAPLVLASSVGMFLMLALMKQLGRGVGAIMLGLYIGYIILLYSNGGAA